MEDYYVKDGKKFMSDELKYKTHVEYLSKLWPIEITKEKLVKSICKIISQRVSPSDRVIVVTCDKRIEKTLFACYLQCMFNKRVIYGLLNMDDIKDEFYDYDKSYEKLSHLEYDILFLYSHNTETQNKMSGDIICSSIDRRRINNQITVIFFWGTAAEFDSKTGFMATSGKKLKDFVDKTIELTGV